MIVSTRTLRRAGIGAGLALALVVPATGVATAAPIGPVHTVAVASVSPATRDAARATLRAALAAAAKEQAAAVAAARLAFDQDPDVVLAKSQRLSVVNSATNPALILAANHAYGLAVSGAAETRDAAIDAARTTRFAGVDAAYAAYDLVVNPPNALARNAFRAAMRSANYELRTHVTAAHRAFRMSTAAAHAQQRASVNVAIAAYVASGRSAADLAALVAAVDAARAAFVADPAVGTARMTRHTALVSAWTSYAAEVRAARRAFHQATGHWPHTTPVVIPSV